MFERLRTSDRNRLAVACIGLAIVFFLALNVLANATLETARLDLTADSRFTLSEGTKQVLQSIEEPITLRYYRSARLDELGPVYRSHAKRVGELMASYARLSEGRLRVETYDPEPFSPEEDLAVADGLSAITIDAAGQQIFFGLAGHNSTDDLETIEFLAPERANFLEYDLTRLVHDLANPEKPVVGLIGDLPMRGGQFNRFQPWHVMDSIGQFFELRSLQGSFDRIDEEIDILLLAQPTSLDERALYAIDQFVMRGGRVLAFVDPLSEVMQRGGPRAAPQGSAVETLEPLLAAWGVEIPADKVIGDRRNAVRVRAYHQGREVITRYLPWLGVSTENLARDDVITGNLEKLNLRSAGSIRAREGAETSIEPLVSSSAEAMAVASEKLVFAPDPVELMNGFEPSGEPFVLAARVTGPVKSAFPDGPPEAVEDKALREAHKNAADAPLNLVLVADSDLLADENWVRSGDLLGQQFAMPIANNGDLAVNALDNLRGSHGLIALRGRGLAVRPFEVLQAMTREAEEKFRAKEQALLAKIEQTQSKIRELQEEEQEGGVILTAAQQQAIDDFRTDMLEARRELRDVQHALRQDVERLETWVRVVNIWAVPLLVGALAALLALVRRRRAARFQASVAGS